uniref:Uncharacterized protein n=1 Tax=Kalanchoe fedtschenkoi TaxID=63787 RepID=A0A7N0VL60_KALFE
MCSILVFDSVFNGFCFFALRVYLISLYQGYNHVTGSIHSARDCRDGRSRSSSLSHILLGACDSAVGAENGCYAFTEAHSPILTTSPSPAAAERSNLSLRRSRKSRQTNRGQPFPGTELVRELLGEDVVVLYLHRAASDEPYDVYRLTRLEFQGSSCSRPISSFSVGASILAGQGLQIEKIVKRVI